MKKLIIFAGAMLLLAAGTVGFFASRPMSAQEALILKNVEAIARNENDHWFTRYITGSIYYPGYGNISCCVYTGIDTDACNYGVVSCINRGSGDA